MPFEGKKSAEDKNHEIFPRIQRVSEPKTIAADNKSLVSGLQIDGGPGALSHDLKIWPITFQGSGPSGPILFSCEKISL